MSTRCDAEIERDVDDPVGTIRRHPDGDRFAIRTYAIFSDKPDGYTTWTHVSIAGVAATPNAPVGDYYDSWPVIYRPALREMAQ